MEGLVFGAAALVGLLLVYLGFGLIMAVRKNLRLTDQVAVLTAQRRALRTENDDLGGKYFEVCMTRADVQRRYDDLVGRAFIRTGRSFRRADGR